ncbi:MAG: hypothetical protein DI551_12500, partial [Micavibrio aeruginosavorus]
VSANGTSNGVGHLSILTTGDIDVNRAITNAGTGRINLFAGWDGLSGITTPAAFDINDIDLGLNARDVTLGTNGRLSSYGTGTSVLVVASNAFINNSSSGATAISVAGGRYLVYADDAVNTVIGGLSAGGISGKYYNTDPASSIAGASSQFIFVTGNIVSPPPPPPPPPPAPPHNNPPGVSPIPVAVDNTINHYVAVKNTVTAIGVVGEKVTETPQSSQEENGDDIKDEKASKQSNNSSVSVNAGCLVIDGSAGGCIVQ